MLYPDLHDTNKRSHKTRTPLGIHSDLWAMMMMTIQVLLLLVIHKHTQLDGL